MKIDGKQIAQEILDNLKKQTAELNKKNITPHLAIILVGDDPSSIAYVNQKELKAASIGIEVITHNLESRIKNSELIKLITKLNNDKNVHGIIVQRPLPTQINAEEISQAVSLEKDVDGFNLASKFEMPIAMAVLKILEKTGANKTDLKSKKIVIMGKGETGGRPIADSLKKLGINPAIIDSETKNPQELTKKADIIICAVGKPNVLKPQMIKNGVTLIGIGISTAESAKLMGDYDQDKVKNIAGYYTPTPGGVGPINVAMLLKNLMLAAERSPR